MKKIKEDCPCPKKQCKNHGKCFECVENHLSDGKQAVFCMRDKIKNE